MYRNIMSELDDSLKNWSKYAKEYDPIKCASIDGIDIEPHDRAVIRALNSEYKPNRFVKGQPECTIFVSRLNHETSKETIKDIFSKYGKLKRFRMVKDVVTGMPKGYAFVEYEEEQAAEEAYRLANKMPVDGNIIFVDFECERLLKGWRPRRLGGGFAGKKESGQLRFGGRDRPFKKPIALELKEKEEKKLRAKKRWREEEQKHYRDKSRERNKKRSSLKNSRNSPLKDRIKHVSPVRDEVKKSVAIKEKERSKSPPRKVSKLNLASKESGRHQPSAVVKEKERSTSPPRKVPKLNSSSKDSGRHQSPLRENTKQRSPRQENIKQHSPHGDQSKLRSPPREISKHYSTSRKHGARHTSPHENVKRQISPADKARIRSPLQKHRRQHSPLREKSDRYSRDNINHESPPRENVRGHLSRQDTNRHFNLKRENMKYSPTRDQTIEHRSPLQKHFRSNSRENERPHSPLQRSSQFQHSIHGNDNFFPREDFGYQSPRRQDIKPPSPRKNERHISPLRGNDRQYFSARENMRYRSPIRENNARRPISPQTRINRRDSPVRDFIQHYSPTREYHHSSLREPQLRSPPRENPRNFPYQHENVNYPPPYYSESSNVKNFSPGRETTRSFTSPRTVRESPHFRDDFPPSRENIRYPPPREHERQHSHYSSAPHSENYDYFPHEQNTTFSPSRDSLQFSQLRNNMDWHPNPQSNRRRFAPQRGKYRGGFKRYQ